MAGVTYCDRLPDTARSVLYAFPCLYGLSHLLPLVGFLEMVAQVARSSQERWPSIFVATVPWNIRQILLRFPDKHHVVFRQLE